ncbi:porin [Burkholderia glumae]|uniref:porin n=1 Tax=Burkholderia glumae TaxID=337 RepID=UPI000C27A644|nr:porin [Burkholderia glumae]MCQ0031628.1 porin [Burkholderia glumae]MCQ0039658.1 porin [Burkholderia glumae]MCR1767566.1 porin [Burkholderia glumae]PJO23082.1 porin [Burkholderia glumae AU6208]QHE10740.1 porin [Burkholderia glumae AU6208]
MKKYLAIPALACALSGAAHAQSSVTLYGTIDAGLDYLSNQKSSAGSGAAYGVQSGNVSTTRWGLRGNEQLGGGLAAVFDLENGFNLANGRLGNGGDEFGRQAWVGLASRRWGTLTLGRQYDFLVDFVAPLSATGSGFGGNIADHPFDNDNLANDTRMNNAVKFRSASYGGITFGGAYAFSNLGGGVSDNNAYSLGAQYLNGPLDLAAAYLQSNQPGGVNAPANTGGALSSADGDSMLVGGRWRTFGAGAHYAFSNASLGFVYTRTILDDPRALSQGGAYGSVNGQLLTFSNYELNARYCLTPAFSLGGSYTFTQGRFDTAGRSIAPKWNQFMLQADYALSRRTDLYLEGTYQRVSGADGVSVLGNAGIFNLAASGNDRQALVAAGIRHRF